MPTLEEHWPPFGVRITEGDLELTVLRERDWAGLAALALSGIHDPEAMPFYLPWTDAPADELPRNSIAFWASTVSGFTPERFSLEFVVRRAGELVGCQGVSTQNFAVTRTGETGSWLARRFHGQGIGTRMRRGVCAFMFDHLGATEVTSGAFMDNPASLAVSRKVGYRTNGVVRLKRREGERADNQHLVLHPEHFVRGDPITVTGAAELRAFIGLAD